MKNMNIDMERICIVGAGLVGSLLAVNLADRGFQVDLYEKRPDMRMSDIPGGRSIVMSISQRGLDSLDRVGMKGEVLSQTLPKHSRMVHRDDETITTQQYGREGQTINTVDRKILNCQLMDRAEKTGKVNIHFRTHIEKMNPETGELIIVNERTGKTSTKRYDRILGTDGIFSSVRNSLEEAGHVESELISMDHGYRELTIPPDENGEWAIEKNYVHVWPRRNFFFLALPRIDGYFCCTMFYPKEGANSFDSLKTPDDVEVFFEKNFPDIKPKMPTLTEDFFNNPASEIFTIKCSPWHYKDKIALLGDAAHAIVPFFAMGMNVCFEDVNVFMGIFDKHDGDWGTVFEEFSRVRKPDTDAIADLSFNNFNEISRSPDPKYDLKWTLERKIWETYPDRWVPLYVMIAFSDIPLKNVIERIEFQKEIVNEIVEKEPPEIINSSSEFKRIVHQYIEPRLSSLEPIKK